ncbi:hypothetical protein HYW43_00245 [Candidatus Daviesbacteria bacterium]|nr:hypothetical protein [Candidatus Daviesbacteria bacterium]
MEKVKNIAKFFSRRSTKTGVISVTSVLSNLIKMQATSKWGRIKVI